MSASPDVSCPFLVLLVTFSFVFSFLLLGCLLSVCAFSFFLPYAVPASFNLFICPVFVSVVDVLVLYCVCRGGGSIPPVSFCAGALPRLMCVWY